MPSFSIINPIILCSIPLTIIVEKLITCLSNIKSTIKSISIQSASSPLPSQHSSKYILIFDQIDPFALLFKPDPKQTSHFKLKSNNIIINSYSTLILNSRLYSVEKVIAPFLQYLHFLFSIADNLNLGHLTYLFNNTKRKFTHLPSAPFSFLSGGDMLTIFAMNHPKKVINLSGKTEEGNVIQPEIIVQGNKSDIVIKLAKMVDYCKKMRLVSTIPLTVFSVVMIANALWKMVPRMKSRKALSMKGICGKCKVNQAQVIMKNCNHFNVCLDCFEENGRKCIICADIIHPEYIVISDY